MDRLDPGEIVKRALAYPYGAAPRSFVQRGERVEEMPPGGPDLAGRTPLLAYGANASPQALGRKLASLPPSPLPVLRAELEGFDVVYSAHVSAYGAVPAALHPSPGTSTPVAVAYPDAEQLQALSATEPNYELTRLRQVACQVDGSLSLSAIDAFLSRHGPLQVDGAAVPLAAVAARGRRLPALTQPQVLELVRANLSPELTLTQFVTGCAELGGISPLPELTRAPTGSAGGEAAQREAGEDAVGDS